MAKREPTPLAVAALALVTEHVTPQELVARFASMHATIDEATAKALLDELTKLGLVRVVHSDHQEEHFRTPLGERLLADSFAGRAAETDLLEEVEHMRTDLLSTIAHELRTPLTAVRTSVGLLLDPVVEPTADERRQLLEAVDRNATRMQRVVGDILDLSRFRAGSVRLQLRQFDANDVARSAVASVAPLARAHDQKLEMTLAPEPALVFGDYRRLEQALVNLLSNAQKYSPDGSAIKMLVKRDAGQFGPEISWTVRDYGPGIPRADRARLFERFFVARHTRSEAVAGIGLGLPIALLIVQAHEGRVDVASSPGKGSTFTIVVPAAGPQSGLEE
ncbi:MAG TPA: HAMP domain-containing sensor histidine kinase [Candidatus Limnocylindrales bacterium]|jgi:signal transduction histidine kinase